MLINTITLGNLGADDILQGLVSDQAEIRTPRACDMLWNLLVVAVNYNNSSRGNPIPKLPFLRVISRPNLTQSRPGLWHSPTFVRLRPCWGVH